MSALIFLNPKSTPQKSVPPQKLTSGIIELFSHWASQKFRKKTNKYTNMLPNDLAMGSAVFIQKHLLNTDPVSLF